jgi:aminotransferase
VAEEHERKRDIFCQALAKAGLTPHVPEGAYYVLADLSRLPGRDDKEKAMFLLEETGVACVPGRAFFRQGRGQNLGRFCFAKKEPVLLDACERLLRLG